MSSRRGPGRKSPKSTTRNCTGRSGNSRWKTIFYHAGSTGFNDSAGVEPNPPHLSVVRQCHLPGINRSSYYYKAVPLSERDPELMRRIDEQYMKQPTCGSRRVSAWLWREGFPFLACRSRMAHFAAWPPGCGAKASWLAASTCAGGCV